MPTTQQQKLKRQAQANVDAAQGDVNTTQSKADSAKKILDGTDAQAIIDQAKAAKGKVAVDKIDVATKEKSAEQASNAKQQRKTTLIRRKVT